MPLGRALLPLAAVPVAAFAWRQGHLTANGALAALPVGGATALAGGSWSSTLLFFVASAAVWARRPPPSSFTAIAAKGDRRDARQVMANGSVATLAAVGALTRPSTRWPIVAAGALAAATADTWATEIGGRAGRAPRSLRTGRPVPPGTSGAVTPQGLLASVAGAFALAAVGAATGMVPPRSLPAIGLAGSAGALADTLLGATVQAVRRCPVCGRDTEQLVHVPCGSRTLPERGWTRLDNDAVNLLATGIGGVLALLGSRRRRRPRTHPARRTSR